MYDFNQPYGESCYRLMSRTGQFIYLKTRGCLEVDDKTRQVHSFVCVNSLVSDEEGRRLIREMKKKFSAIISEAELSAMESDVPAVENPQKLERAILNLITNLNNTTSYDDDNVSMISDSTVDNDDARRIKSPPMAIIAPKSNTIKPSLFKAGCVLAHSSKCRTPPIKDEPKSPEAPNETNVARSPLTRQLIIKVETSTQVLSPASSSRSSIDSDISFVSNGRQAQGSRSRQATPNTVPNNSDLFSSYENLPVYDSDSVPCTIASASNDSTMTASSVNNNSSKNNRNSVLKRTRDLEDDYTELIKKRTLSDLQNPEHASSRPPLDLLNTSGSGEVYLLL